MNALRADWTFFPLLWNNFISRDGMTIPHSRQKLSGTSRSDRTFIVSLLMISAVIGITFSSMATKKLSQTVFAVPTSPAYENVADQLLFSLEKILCSYRLCEPS